MNIKSAIESFNSSYTALRLNYPDKEYIFTTTVDNAEILDKDFIFIPLSATNKNVFQTLKKVLKNKYCKGFILNRGVIEDNDSINRFHIFMKDLDNDPEVVILVRNIYNFAHYTAENITKNSKIETIEIVGTDKTSIVKDLIVSNLEGKKFTYSKNEWNIWQKIYEPILMSNNDTDYAVIEVQPMSPEVTICASRFDKKHILFTRSAICKMDVYCDIEGLSDNILNVINNEQAILSIWSPDYNELISDRIPQKFSKRIHLIPSNKNAEKKLEREYTFVFDFLRSMGLNPCIKDGFNGSNPLFETKTYNGSEYFVINNKRVLFDSVKTTVKAFNQKYKDKKKIIVFEHIAGLGIYKKACVKELFKLFADVNPDCLVLLNTEANNHLFKKNKQNTYVKNLPFDPNIKETKANLKSFLKGVITEGSAVYAASCHDISFLFGGDI